MDINPGNMPQPHNPHREVSHEVVMADADDAIAWLTRNQNNRTLREQVITRYNRDMVSGRWHYAADPIRFDADGNLQDGQHRLTALALTKGTGVKIPLLIVRGLPDKARDVMDQGVRRSIGDQLQMRGTKNAHFVGSAVRNYLMWEQFMASGDPMQAMSLSSRSTVTTPEVEEWVEKHRDVEDFMATIASLLRRTDAPYAIAGAAALKFREIDPEEAVQFFRILATGSDGGEGHPITTLDKRLARNRREGLRISQQENLAMIVQSWNAWRDGRSILRFQRPRAGSMWMVGNFPVPR